MKKTKIIIFCLAFVVVSVGFKNFPAKAEISAPVFQESFEGLGEMTANGMTMSGVTLEPGRFGNAVKMDGSDTLSFPTADNINFQKGSIEFWVKTDMTKNYLHILKATSGNVEFRIERDYDEQNGFTYVRYVMNDGVKSSDFSVRQNFLWRSDEWHKIQLFWDFTIADQSKRYVGLMIDGDWGLMCDPGVLRVNLSYSTVPATFSIYPNYNSNSSIDELKIYDHSLLPAYDTNPLLYNPKDPQTEQKLRDFTANDGICENYENNNDSPNDCPRLSSGIKTGESVISFQKTALERVFPGTVPREAEIKDTMSYQMPGGKFEDLFFNVYSRENLDDARLDYTDFTRPGGATISRDNLDLRVVKNWFQGGADSWYVGYDVLPAYIPEMLMYDDRLNLDQGDWTQDNLPSVPVLDHVETTMKSYTSKQFSLIAHVPAGTPAGNYTATVTLKNNGVVKKTIQINLEVLPFDLKDTGKDNAIFAWGSTGGKFGDTWRGPLGYTEDSFIKQLKDIHNHGFNGIILGYHFIDDKRMLQDVANQGFKMADPWGITKDLVDFGKSLGLEIYGLGSDEANSVEGYATNYMPRAINFSNSGAKVVADFLDRIWAEKLRDPNDEIYTYCATHTDPATGKPYCPPGTYEPVDWENLGIESSGVLRDYFNGLMNGTISKDPNILQTYYWQSLGEDPRKNRFLSGYYLWNSPLNGITPHAYETSYPWHPYVFNEFALSDPARSDSSRDGRLTYPTQQGPIPTIQWEGMREGIDDGRYVATWKYYRDKASATNPSLASDSEKIVNNILSRYKDINNWSNVSMAQYEADRKTIIQEILKLKQYANPFNADLNTDSLVNVTDFNILKSDFLKLAGNLTNPKSDIDGDGQATIKDVGILMSGWK